MTFVSHTAQRCIDCYWYSADRKWCENYMHSIMNAEKLNNCKDYLKMEE